MKVRFNFPIDHEGLLRDLDLPLVPRVGEVVDDSKGNEYIVRTVVWYPYEVEPMAYVVLKRP